MTGDPQPSLASVGAIVVNYESASLANQCAQDLAEQGIGEIVIVDNSESEIFTLGPGIERRGTSGVPDGGQGGGVCGHRDTDGALGGHRDKDATGGLAVRVVRSGANLGYGAGANLGESRLSPNVSCVLVCNPDLTFRPHALERLMGGLSPLAPDLRPGSFALLGPKILNPDGTAYPTGRSFPDPLTALGHALLGPLWPGNPFTAKYHGKVDEPTRAGDPAPRSGDLVRDPAPRQVDWVSGSCILVDRNVFNSVGGFDESFHMYMEDVDLCRRIAAKGFKVGIVDEAIIVHVGGVSSSVKPYRMIWAHFESAARFSWRALRGPAKILWPGAVAALFARSVVATIQRIAAGYSGDKGIASQDG